MEVNSEILKRDLNARELFSLAFGAIVGVSWIVLVGQWITEAGPYGAMLAFVIGGLLMLPIGFCYAELGQRFPATGGEFVYAFRFFGTGTAFATAWILALFYVAVCAFEAVSISWLAAAIWPAAKGPELYRIASTPVHLGDAILGVALASALGAIQLRGAQMAARLQDILVISMVSLAILFLLAATVTGSATRLEPAFGSFDGFMALLLATPLFFAGFNSVPQALGESSDAARRKLPMIIFVVILASMAFKVAVILATGLVLTGPEASAAEVPVALAFERAFGSKWLSLAALFTGVMGLLTTWNAALFGSSRVLYALGHSRLGPRTLGRIGLSANVPFISIIFVTAITILAVPLGREIIIPVISLGGICVTLMMVLVSACLWKGRKEAGRSRYALPASCMLISITLLGLMLNEIAEKAYKGEFIELAIVGIWTVLGLIFWFASARSRNDIDNAEREALILGAGAGS